MATSHTVTVSIYYDEKVKTNKRGSFNKLREGGKIFETIIFYYFQLDNVELDNPIYVILII